MSLGTPRAYDEENLEPLAQADAAETAQPQSSDLNKAIERLRDAVHDKNFAETLAAYLAMPDQASQEIALDYIKAYPDLMLYITLATRKGFSWEKQLDAANANIARINAANVGLNLQANYELPDLINALAKQNDPEQLMANLKLMKDPRLVIAPEGLALNHLTGLLTVNGVAPYISEQHASATLRTQTAVYLIDAGNLNDINTQPEAVKLAANDNYNNLTYQRLREIASNSGMKLDEHGYGMLAAMLRRQDPQTNLDMDSQIFNVFTNEFANSPNQIAYGYFNDGQCIFGVSSGTRVISFARIRPSVMAVL